MTTADRYFDEISAESQQAVWFEAVVESTRTYGELSEIHPNVVRFRRRTFSVFRLPARHAVIRKAAQAYETSHGDHFQPHNRRRFAFGVDRIANGNRTEREVRTARFAAKFSALLLLSATYGHAGI